MAITDRSTKQPLINTIRIGHGTLESNDLATSRRFYEEVLGFDVIQTSAATLQIRKNTDTVYVVVQGPHPPKPMNPMNHNGVEVADAEAVDAAYETILSVKDDYGIKMGREPRQAHGDYGFTIVDIDGNYWEILATREGGYAASFADPEPERDLTGLHQLDSLGGNANRNHTHDAEFRKWLRAELAKEASTEESKQGAT